jgi:hypothetical protein
MSRPSNQEKYEAIAFLKNEIRIKPGDRIQCVLRSVSRSGMSRSISLFVIKNKMLYDISHAVYMATQGNWDRDRHAVKIGGCGMDMGFAIVYDLNHALFPNGFKCIGKNCPSNDHFNYKKEECPKHHKDGGYALKHNWV